MVQSLLNDDIWCYWVISVGALFSFVGLIVACICSCRRNDNKSEFLGLAGMVTTHLDNDGFSRIAICSEVAQTYQTLDTVDGTGKRSNTANRSLPDIPKDRNIESDGELRDEIYEITENISGDPSELYATVQDKNKDKQNKNDKQSISQQSSQDETASLYSKLTTPQISNEHPYAQVQNIHKTENLLHTSINHTIDLAQPSTSGTLPIAPPRSRRSSSHTSLMEQPIIVDIPAATAITGGVQANQDLPYMTPPILMPLPQPPQLQNNSLQQQNFSDDSQDSKGYTSISVREPLANIIAQTKNVQQHRQATRPLTDPHYATLSDDSDEMYAAIDEQDKVYTSGSETYAQIQPMAIEANRQVQNEQASAHLQNSLRSEESYVLAPQPPSVDSLRHVAHAHSRQASSSSATSSVANPGSPKPEKRQANSPLPPPPDNAMEMYAIIDKRNKTDDRFRGSAAAGKSLEDMYAKVMKKKRDSNNEDGESASNSINNSPNSMIFVTETAATTSRGDGVTSTACRKLSLIDVSQSSWSNHDSVEIPKRDSNSGHLVKEEQQLSINGEHYDAFDIDHGYEAVVVDKRIDDMVSDANYETLRPLSLGSITGTGTSGSINGINDAMPIYSMPFKHRQVSNASSEDPGYERVRLCKRPVGGYCEDLNTDSEPNYESMPHENTEPNYASVSGYHLGSQENDLNYENVSNGNPNYESVKYINLTQELTSEPPYERLASYKDLNLDPDYERIESTKIPTGNNVDTDDEQYIQV